MKAKNFFSDLARGTSMGLGAIPGVSAGTTAIVAGIYERMIAAISNLRHHFKESFMTLLPMFIGAVISAVAFMVLVHYGYAYAPFAIACLFAGFTLGSLPIITKEIKGQKVKKSYIFLLIGGFLLASGIGALSVVAKVIWHFDLQSAFDARSWWVYLVVLLAGAIAAMACIVPGISGAMILYICGLYTPIVNLYIGPSSIFHQGASSLGTGLLLTLLLLVGVLVGVLLTGKGMEKLLEKHRVPTFYTVLGFVAGSVVSMFINQEIWPYYYGATLSGEQSSKIIKTWQYPVGIVLFLIALFGTYYIINRYVKKQSNAPKEGDSDASEH